VSTPIALVIGGTSGIGLATARRLHSLGAKVHIVGRTEQRLATVAESDPSLTGHQADAGDRAQIEAVIETIGDIDWLVVTASSTEGPGPIGDLDLAMLRRAFDGKFWAHLTTIQAALPRLSPMGSITLLGAITARAGMPGTAGIAAVNGAVEALIKPLAVELAPIRVNAVSPGLVDTPWWSGLPEEARQEYFDQAAQALPSGRIATADDIAEATVLAATNPNVTGSIFETDGGARLVSLG
jgi:NAD(P)-dependent dehydrogenase (short-subunit alcohol dehydrogenase family)